MAGTKGRSGGWNRKTAEEHAVHGTLRPDRHGALALAPVRPAPLRAPSSASPPRNLSRAAQASWRRYLDEYEAWTATDLLLLELALHAQDRAAQCRRRLRREGLVLRGRRGALRIHPLVRVEKAAVDFMLGAFKQLGLGGRDA